MATDQNTGHSFHDFLCNRSKLIGISSFLVHSWVTYLPAQFHAIRVLVAIGGSVFVRLTMKAQYVKVFRV